MRFLLPRKPAPSFGSTWIRRPIVWHFRQAAHILAGPIRTSSLVALLVLLSSVTVGHRQATIIPPIVDPGALKLPVALDVRAERDLAASPGEKAFQRGLAAFNAGGYLEAVRWFEESVRLSPDLAEAHTNLGLAYVELSRIEEGIRELEQAVSLDLAQGQAKFHVAMAYGQAGQTQEALLRLGKCFFKKDDPARAFQYFTRVITVSPETPQAREARAFLKQLKSRG